MPRPIFATPHQQLRQALPLHCLARHLVDLPAPAPSHRSMMAIARPPLGAAVSSVADAATWYAALVLGALVLLSSLQEGGGPVELDQPAGGGRLVLARPCDEIYVVGEGETLHSISDKCGDPFIVERNPHIHDPDDVFPGLVIMITPSKPPV